MEKKLKKNLPLLSIIVPVFNNIKGIKRVYDKFSCFEKIELVIVDDGSNSENKINSKTFNLCTIVPQKNNGVSNARNTGILNSNGKYITFLDSDDDILGVENILNYLSKTKIKSTIIFYPIIKLFSNGFEELTFSPKLPYKGYVAGKIVKREFLIKNNFKFNEKLKICEDSVFWSKILLKIEKTTWIKNSSYLYFQSENGKLDLEKIFQIITVLFILMPKLFYKSNCKKLIKQDFIGILIYLLTSIKNKFCEK